ncbi:sigma-70 family RNA polymerase sigma factor [Pseudomonas sp. NPDC090202]|uniref:sigma-70 family RNA polymerase sigma factor n=1 Tax=unclassified Pseudomonas TaxID=196821 RepID=UPI00381ED591
MSADNLDQLYQAHHGWLHSFLHKRIGHSLVSVEAADLVHDTFMRLLLKPRTFASASDARAFLCTVAKGLYVDQWRRRQMEQAWAESMAALAPQLVPDSEYQASVLEALCRVDAMLRKLSARARRAFLLAQIHGLTYAEIAEDIGVSERMVKKYMAQAMFECLALELELADVSGA